MKKFDREKALNKIRLKRKWKEYSKYFYIGIPYVLCGVLGLYFAYSKFFVTQEDAVVQTKVGDFIYGDVIINNYINGQYAVEAPAQGAGYKVDKIVCDNGAIGTWDNKDWGPTIANVTKRNKCNVYFIDAEKVKIGNVYVQLDVYDICPTVNEDGTVTVTDVESTYGYLCSMKDAYGTSYYYRGNVTNNYVYFAGFYWRIIRINGDGSVRVIYDGTSAHVNGESSSDRQIGIITFNSSYDDNAYVGYMYGTAGASTYAETHANKNNSTIKNYLDSWYENNIKGTTNEQYIADNIFCNDRSFADNNSGTGAGTSRTLYRWDNLLYSLSNNKMMLTCPQQNDAFTVSDINKGNGVLTYGIGLITADEVALAGGMDSENSNYYLYSGDGYWTMSAERGSDISWERFVDLYGSVNGRSVDSSGGCTRPVINLKPEVLLQGTGTVSDPYRLAS